MISLARQKKMIFGAKKLDIYFRALDRCSDLLPIDASDEISFQNTQKPEIDLGIIEISGHKININQIKNSITSTITNTIASTINSFSAPQTQGNNEDLNIDIKAPQIELKNDQTSDQTRDLNEIPKSQNENSDLIDNSKRPDFKKYDSFQKKIGLSKMSEDILAFRQMRIMESLGAQISAFKVSSAENPKISELVNMRIEKENTKMLRISGSQRHNSTQTRWMQEKWMAENESLKRAVAKRWFRRGQIILNSEAGTDRFRKFLGLKFKNLFKENEFSGKNVMSIGNFSYLH